MTIYSIKSVGNYTMLPTYNSKDTTYLSPDPIGYYEFNNPGYVSGIIEQKGVVLMGATVMLFERYSNTLVNTAITDNAGYFSFDNLNKGFEFYIVVIGNPEWEWRVKSRFNPV